MKIKLEHDRLNKTLVDFYTLSHVRTVIYDSEFNKLAAYPEKSCDFCELIKKNPESKKLCRMDDTEACKISSQKNKLYIYKCHAGLVEAVMPIMINDMTLGYAMFGQIRNTDVSEEEIRAYASKFITDEKLLEASVKKLKIRSDRQIEAVITVMQACTYYLLMSELIKLDKGNKTYLLSDYITNNISGDLSVERLCCVLKVSRIELYNISHKYYGMGIAKYIRKKRVSIAAEMLTDGYAINKAAESVGFIDSNYFSRVFKEETGMTPTEYKKRMY